MRSKCCAVICMEVTLREESGRERDRLKMSRGMRLDPNSGKVGEEEQPAAAHKAVTAAGEKCRSNTIKRSKVKKLPGGATRGLWAETPRGP